MSGVTFEDNTKLNFTLHGMGREPYCADIIEPLIKKLKPDLFITLLDTFMLMPPHSNYLIKDLSPAKTIFYYPSDGGKETKGDGRLPLFCEPILKKFNFSVAMSKFAQKQARNIHLIDSHYIPHGVWTNIYFPLPTYLKETIKQNVEGLMVNNSGQLVSIVVDLRNKFIVGSVFRNQPRKMADRQIEAFKKFAEGKENVYFYLHCDPLDPAQSFNMIEYITEKGLNNKVIFSGMRYFKGFPVQKMREVYNIMDVFFLSTSGEGFGVPTLEAMSCGVPVLVTDYTTSDELIKQDGQSGEGVKVAEEILGSYNVPRAIMSTDDAAEKLNKLYINPELREKYGKAGREKALKFYDYERIVGPMWERYLEQVIKL